MNMGMSMSITCRLAFTSLLVAGLIGCERRANPSAEPSRFPDELLVKNPRCASEPEAAYVALGSYVLRLHALPDDKTDHGAVVKPVAPPPHGKDTWCKSAPVPVRGVNLVNQQGAYVPEGIGAGALREFTLTPLNNGRFLLRELDDHLLAMSLRKGRRTVEFGLRSCGNPGDAFSIYTGEPSAYFAPGTSLSLSYVAKDQAFIGILIGTIAASATSLAIGLRSAIASIATHSPAFPHMCR